MVITKSNVIVNYEWSETREAYTINSHFHFHNFLCETYRLHITPCHVIILIRSWQLI